MLIDLWANSVNVISMSAVVQDGSLIRSVFNLGDAQTLWMQTYEKYRAATQMRTSKSRTHHPANENSSVLTHEVSPREPRRLPAAECDSAIIRRWEESEFECWARSCRDHTSFPRPLIGRLIILSQRQWPHLHVTLRGEKVKGERVSAALQIHRLTAASWRGNTKGSKSLFWSWGIIIYFDYTKATVWDFRTYSCFCLMRRLTPTSVNLVLTL